MVKSIDRCIDVLGLLGSNPDGWSLTDISRALKAPKSTVLMILRTLVDRNVLVLDRHSKTYKPGAAWSRYATATVSDPARSRRRPSARMTEQCFDGTPHASSATARSEELRAPRPGTTARAVVLAKARTLDLRRLPIPTLGPDDALLKVEACGICGSDYEMYDGDIPVGVPVVPGHEPLGLIAAIGDRAAARWGVAVGDRVAVRAAYGCGRCEACARFAGVECGNAGLATAYGFTDVARPPFLWGAYADYMYLSPFSVVHRMSRELPAEVAVMFNPLGAGLAWARTAPRTVPGDRVVILGCGQRGLCCIVGAREAGAGQIIVTGLGRDQHKLALARELGADVTIDVEREDVVARVQEATGGGAEVVVDTTPTAPQSVSQAVAMAARRGRVVLAGLKGRRAVAEPFVDDVINKELTLHGVLGVPYTDFARAIELLESRKYAVLERMHTHSFALEQAQQALLTLSGAIPGAAPIHIALVPDLLPDDAVGNADTA
jgi:threonine dehydrogenase-like Zn-dependent dehydrogenase